jgi:hypothetical protein
MLSAMAEFTLQDLIDRQAEDAALWSPATASEAYIVNALRAIHAHAEKDSVVEKSFYDKPWRTGDYPHDKDE